MLICRSLFSVLEQIIDYKLIIKTIFLFTAEQVNRYLLKKIYDDSDK